MNFLSFLRKKIKNIKVFAKQKPHQGKKECARRREQNGHKHKCNNCDNNVWNKSNFEACYTCTNNSNFIEEPKCNYVVILLLLLAIGISIYAGVTIEH